MIWKLFILKKNSLRVKIPMISIKVIFDDLSFDIPFFIKECVNADGDLKILTFLRKLALNPSTISDLLILNKKFLKSRKVLEELVNNL